MPKTNLNNIAAMSAQLFQKRVERLGGKGVPSSRMGRYGLIHADYPSAEVIQQREVTYSISEFVVCGCPSCQPYIEEGAFIFYAHAGKKMALRYQSLSPLRIDVSITEGMPLAKPAEG